MEDNCRWLPDLIIYPDWNKYKEYEDMLYIIFKDTYLNARLSYKNKIIKYRYNPRINDKEESFYHCTCKNYVKIEDREPDPNRMIRIKWIKAFIENYNCKFDCCENKPLNWIELYKNRNYRHYIYFERYLVILEERENYYLLISGFYVDKEYYHCGLIKRYKKAENAI